MQIYDRERRSKTPPTMCILCASFWALLPTLSGVVALGQELQALHDHVRDRLVYLELWGETMSGQEVSSEATGVVLSPEGHVITAYHIIKKFKSHYSDRGDPIKDGSLTFLGRLGAKHALPIEMDLVGWTSQRDLMLLDLPAKPGGYPYLCLSAEKLSLGTRVFVAGFPKELRFQSLEGTITGEGRNDTKVMNAPVDQGTSGSPVYLANREVVGFALGKIDGLESAYALVEASYALNLKQDLPQACEPEEVPKVVTTLRVVGLRREIVTRVESRSSPPLVCHAPHCQSDRLVYSAELPV